MPIGRGDALARLAGFMAWHRRRVFAGWLIAVVLGLIGIPPLLAAVVSPPIEVADSESQRGGAVLGAGLPSLGNDQMIAVLHAPAQRASDPVFGAAINAAIRALGRLDGIAGAAVLPKAGDPDSSSALGEAAEPLRPLLRDEHTAYLLVGVSGTDQERQDRVPRQQSAVDQATQTASGGAVRAYLVGGAAFGQAMQQVEMSDLMRIELVAVPAAIAMLLVGLRAPVAAMVPLVIAGVSVVATFGVFAVVRGVFSVDGMLLIGVSAIGLGIGIDYPLFVMNRYRAELSAGADPMQAIRTAAATTGRVVVYSGLILLLACSCLFMVRWHVFAQAAVGTFVVALVTVAASLSLLPAILVSLSGWLEWRPRGMSRGVPPVGNPGEGSGWLARWARHLMRHPWWYAIAVTAGLLVAAVPMLDMRLGLEPEGRAIAGHPFLTGIEIMAHEAPGLASPVMILLTRPTGAAEPDTGPLLAALRADPEVAAATTIDNDDDLTAVFAIPKHLPTTPEVEGLVWRVRTEILPSTAPSGSAPLVGGPSALIADILAETSTKLWWVVGAVLILMLAALVVVLRSVVLPVKAIVMSLLATGASFGLMVLLFQGGDDGSVGLVNRGVIWPQVPLVVFVILFALSTDYELFLVGRIQEEYRKTRDNRGSVVAGLQHTGRSISLAAVILAVGFGSLLVSDISGLRQFGFTLAAALIIDATVVRLVLVPALMQIMGRWNWWFPSVPGSQGKGSGGPPVVGPLDRSAQSAAMAR
ncbi:MMPL family transporter [Nocardia sp. NPDC049149]|uniref:MMPL family transporter n=1 Tax=Nocardia sp. NPDC049149 TaxID=3364315 RepID=UPI0037162EFF